METLEREQLSKGELQIAVHYAFPLSLLLLPFKQGKWKFGREKCGNEVTDGILF